MLTRPSQRRGPPKDGEVVTFSPRFVIEEFNASNRELASQDLRALLDCLTRVCANYFRRNPHAPSIYTCGVRYRREPREDVQRVGWVEGKEDWQSPAETLRRGFGDCEDLACYQAAWYQVMQGKRSFAQFYWKNRPDGGATYHIIIQHPNGSHEDPSARLGMGQV